jgi:D-tyrosyl-tRNA(Tyr) deacylase
LRVVLQRVGKAAVRWQADGADRTAAIGPGLVLLLGVGPADSEIDARRLAAKVADLRIFADAEGRFNRSLLETGGEVLCVSQFTLFADTRRGRRPSFIGAADPEPARALYLAFVEQLRAAGITVATGEFGAHMTVSLDNDGPVTLVMSTDDWDPGI